MQKDVPYCDFSKHDESSPYYTVPADDDSEDSLAEESDAEDTKDGVAEDSAQSKDAKDSAVEDNRERTGSLNCAL